MTMITLPDAPSIPSLNFRLYCGAADLPALMQLRREIATGPEFSWMPTADQFEHNPDEIPYSNRDCLIAQLSDQLIGFTWLDHWMEKPDKHVYLLRGFLHPTHRRKGIGRAILHWQENHVRQLHHHLHSEALFELAANADDNQPSLRALLQSEGYRVASTMVRLVHDKLHPVALQRVPASFEIRPITPQHLPQVWHLIHAALPDGDEGYTDSLVCDLSLWAAAFHNANLAGVVITHIQNGIAESPWVAVAPEFRRRGLARALLAHSLVAIRSRGATSATIETSLQNKHSAVHLYESLGYRIAKRMPRYRKSLSDTP